MNRYAKWLALVLLAAGAVIAYLETSAEQRSAWWDRLARTQEPAAGDEVDDTEEPGGAGGDDDEDIVPSRLRKVEGLNAIRLSEEEQRQTGVATDSLVESRHLSESLAAGRVLDVQPLVNLRSEYNAARGEAEVHRAVITASARAAERLRTLNREDGNVSTRQLQEAQSQAASDRARLAAAERRLQDIRNQALLQWGPTVVNMVLEEDSERFDRLIAQQDVLVLVTLRRGEQLPAGLEHVYVGPTGDRGRAREADLISPAAQTDSASQGETYLFRTNANMLRVGMRMDVWIPRPGQPAQGVEVPGSAVIWYANKLWVYEKSGEELFVRQPLRQYEETRDGWFVTEGIEAGDKIVVSGAQMLFSEEFRSAIPSEDEARE